MTRMCVGVMCALLSATAQAAIVAASYFDSGMEGWFVLNNCTVVPDWSATGGQATVGHDATGYIHATDCDADTAFWLAPDDFLGDKSAAYGGTLSFWMKSSHIDQLIHTRDIVMTGVNNRDLRIKLPASPTREWTYFSVKLDVDAGWRLGPSDGLASPVPTEAEFREVLGSIVQLTIRAEHSGHNNVVFSLDDVVMQTPCPRGDLDGDGVIGLQDLAILLAAFGTICP